MRDHDDEAHLRRQEALPPLITMKSLGYFTGDGKLAVEIVERERWPVFAASIRDLYPEGST